MRSTTTKLTAVALSTAVLASLPTAASASTPSKGLTHAYDTVYQRVDRAGGRPGRNIADDGVRKGGRDRPATRTEVLSSLGTLRTMHASLTGTAPAAGSGTTAGSPATADPASTAAGAASAGSTGAGSGLASVAACESGGDPTAVSPSGQYRGKYQFDQQTWESVGGSGDPAAAPEAVQDQKAAQLQAQRGSSPWPVCG